MHRWLPIKLPVRQPSLGRMLRVCLAHAVRRVQEPATLQNLRCVHRDQLFPWLEARGSQLVLQQPRIEQVENDRASTRREPPQLAASFAFGRCCLGEGAVMGEEGAVMFRAILNLLTALALCASAPAGLAQQNAASQPIPYLNAQAAPPAAATPSAPAASQAVAPAAAQPAPATATAVPAASAPEAGGDNAKSLKSTVPVPHYLSRGRCSCRPASSSKRS